MRTSAKRWMRLCGTKESRTCCLPLVLSIGLGRLRRRFPAETHKEEDAMLDFEEEITRFKPSMEVGEVEEAIVREDLTDMTDLMVEFLKNGTEQSGKE